ncbi:Putative high-affinity branched-chain amino acid transport system permease protein LivH/BraD [Herminiimonas arsenicoxydans]|uniref:High-affinity branched-chain amino acid transport system permease protein LivH/BraD n=1 Tax=Herminiimonas arsenicoxydans TaxID=204773 RepID=A4G8G6_HERAR|nr:Putative high-affinity branched-chain amino acid transport system permease protein LivH/BraD [Herminiimonas arsenicoxydans]
MSTFLQYVLSGLSIGAIYSLVALGFYIMWSACRSVNFAHGDVMMVGAVLAVVSNDFGLSPYIGIPLSIVACVLYGVLVERFAVRPYTKEANAIGWMLTTIAIGIMVESFVTIKFGSFARALPSPGVDKPITIFGAGIYLQEMLIPLFVILFMIGLEVFYRRTMLGRAMRAVAFNRIAAGMMGINVGMVTSFSFALAAGLGGIAGILIGPIIQVSSTMGVLIGLKGFAVAIMASITSARGVVITGLLYGVLEKFVEGYISSAAREVVGFSIMILVLLMFPQGLFGRKELTKV